MKTKIHKTLLALALATSFCASAVELPNVTAQAWLVADESGKIIEGTHTTDVRSIASITKLMTSIVVLDSKQSLEEVLPRKLHNRFMTRQQLLDLAIVKSDNNAAKMLCEYYVGGTKACVTAMNEKAATLGMNHTFFTDSTGLYHTNVSTAEDLIKLVMASSTYQVIVNASSKNMVRLETSKKKFTEFRNTNWMVGKGHDFIVSKTGFISKSGGCIVFMLNTLRGVRTVVLLGSKNTKTRILEAYLISEAY